MGQPDQIPTHGGVHGVVPDGADIDLRSLSDDELAAMADAAREVSLCMRVLAKTGDHVVTEILRGAGPFFEWRHYPASDIYDPEYHAQYYYHAHPAEERVEGEHGHFHTFLRPLGMPPDVVPLDLPDLAPDPDGNEALSHLIGISMDKAGQPIRLFTTNRWVTGETWYTADDVIRMLDNFVVDHARPSWPLNRWVTALMRLYRPQIASLLRSRDATVTAWQAAHPDSYVYEDRRLDIVSEFAIDVDGQIQEVEQEVRRRRRSQRDPRGRG